MARDRLLDAVRDRGKPQKPEFREPEDENDDIDLDDPDENDPDENDDDDDDSDDKDNDEVDESKLPDNVRAILKKNRDETRQAKRDLRDARKAAEKPKDDDKDKDRDRGPSEREVKIESRLKRTALKAELLGAGVSSSNARLLIGQAKLSDLELDDDDEVDARDLEDAVEEMKREFPDLFGKARKDDKDEDEDPAARRRRSRQTGGAGRRPAADRGPRQSADALADILTGKTR